MIFNKELIPKISRLNNPDVQEAIDVLCDHLQRQFLQELINTDEDRNIYKIKGKIELLEELREVYVRINDAKGRND